MTKKKLAICIPVWDYIPAEFFSNFLEIIGELIRLREKLKTKIYCSPHKFITQSRTELVQKALGDKAEWILFLDVDNIIRPDFISRMLEHNKDIITTITFRKVAPYEPVIFRKEYGYFVHINDFRPNSGLIPVDAFGFGCTLIKADVFRRVSKEWFVIKKSKGEDIYFSEKVKKAHIQAYADTSLICGHYGGTVGIESFIQHRDFLIDRDNDKRELVSFIANSYNMNEKDIIDKLMKKHKNYDVFERVDWHLRVGRDIDLYIIDEIKKMKMKYGDIKILDVDMGIRQIARKLDKEGIDVLTIDNNRFPMWKSKKMVKSIEDLKAKSINVIIANDFFEHLDDENLQYYIGHFKRIITSRGKILSKTIEHSRGHKHYKWTEKRIKIMKELTSGNTNNNHKL